MSKVLAYKTISSAILTITLAFGLLFHVTPMVTPLIAAEFEGVSFRVLTYNIRTGLGSRKLSVGMRKARHLPRDLNPVIRAIGSVNPDVVALQEVLGRSQAQEIANALGMHMTYVSHGVEGLRRGAWWGLAILSRYPIERHLRAPISTGSGNTKSLLIATIRIKNRSVTLANIHKDKDIKSGDPLRRAMEWISKISGPVVILGDLNIRPGDRRLEILQTRYTDTLALVRGEIAERLRHHATFHKQGRLIPGKRIDQIWVDERGIDVMAVGLFRQGFWLASDHIGVTADLTLN